MPPKRRTEDDTSGAPPKQRLSKLAKEHNITAAEENEIREAFSLFAEKRKEVRDKEGVIPIEDVRRAMIALSLPPTPTELAEFLSILDPEADGYALFPSFLAICALKLHARTQHSAPHAAEVDEAFALFTRGGGVGGRGAGGEQRITLAMLKRVAAELREEVPEEVLRDMILEANGGAGVGRGVERGEFEGVMRRAGVWR